MKTGKTRKMQTNKRNYMSDEGFADLKEAMEDAVAFEGSKRRNLRVTRIQAPRQRSRTRSDEDTAGITRLPAIRNSDLDFSGAIELIGESHRDLR